MDAILSTLPAIRLAPAVVPYRPPPPTGTDPRLSVVIVNYRHWPDTARLVQQLRAALCLRDGAAEVVVVDNHSPTHPVVPRLRRWPGVSLRRWRRNRGFARAVNEGCRLSRGDWLLLLNPDMTLDPGFLDAVLARADVLSRADPRAGIVGFRLRNPDGSPQLSSGPFPTLTSTLTRLLLPRARRKYSTPPPGGPTPLDWVTGCCLLLRRGCWEDLGGLDASFFLYYEDVDLCRRARGRGWTVWFDPGPCAVHLTPLHARTVPAHLRVVTRHSLLTYARKHWPAWQLHVLSAIVRAEARLRGLLARCRHDGAAVAAFAALGALARDLARGRPGAARRRLHGVLRAEEDRLAPAPVPGHSQPQPARSAAPVPAQHPPARPAGHGSAGRR
jgi:GT2 family glycosyltransferase